MVSVYLGLAQKLEPEKKEETGKLIPADSAIVWSLWSIGTLVDLQVSFS